MVPLSAGIASSVLIAQSLGAGWPAVAEIAMKRTLRLTLSIAVLASLVLYLFRGAIIWLYTSEPPVHDLAASLLLFGCFYHVFDAMQSVSSFALRGYRVTFAPMLIYGVLLWGVGLGLGYFFAFGGEWAGGPYGAYGFWGTTAAGLFLTGIALFVMAFWVARSFSKDEKHSSAEVAAAIEAARGKQVMPA